MCNILKTRTMSYNLRSQTDFVRDCVKTLYGLNSQSYLAKVCDMILSEIKNLNPPQKLKTNVENWAPANLILQMASKSQFLCTK